MALDTWKSHKTTTREADADRDHAAQLADLQVPDWVASGAPQIWELVGAARVLYAGELHTGEYRVEDLAGNYVTTVGSFAELPTN